MPRIVKDPDVRRNEILDVAQKQFYQKGYEQTAIRDVIDEVGIAKGTFYYYFNSKLDLLDAMIERMFDQNDVGQSAAYYWGSTFGAFSNDAENSLYQGCEVTGEHPVGDHVVVFGAVTHAALLREGDPSIHLRKNGLGY